MARWMDGKERNRSETDTETSFSFIIGCKVVRCSDVLYVLVLLNAVVFKQDGKRQVSSNLCKLANSYTKLPGKLKFKSNCQVASVVERNIRAT